jgi:hypothetical protein
MRERLPRRYDATVRFLRETLANEKIKHNVRMQAALRLSEIMLQHDEAINRRERAKEKERAAARLPDAPAEPEEEHSPLSSADALQRAQEFLKRSRTNASE